MSSLDVEQLLAPVSEDAPVGENLEYDDQFGALEIAAQGKPEQIMGDEVKAAEEPDWQEVKSAAVDLLGRTKDLRVGVHLANAACRREGFDGLADALAVIRGMLENYWEHVYPVLDEEDDNDPTLRVNSLLPLSDPAQVLGAARMTPMVTSTVLGKFSLRDLWIAKGDLSPPSGMEALPEIAHIDGAFLEAELDDLTATAAAVDRAVDSITAIESVVTEQVGAVNAPDLSLLTRDLKEVKSVVSEHLARRGIEGFAEGDGEAGEGGRGGSGAINTREDVVRTLDRICDYFQRNEPTSPIPLLLRRAQRMVKMDFLEILREMTPDGVHQAETVFGVNSDSNEV